MEVFRISKRKFSEKLLSSGDANRWNKAGQKVIYTGGSRSLSTLELIVHRSAVMPADDFKVMVISIPDDEKYIRQLNIRQLPDNWRKISGYSGLQEIGSDWYISKESPVLKVPSVVIPLEFNFVINTVHPDFEKNVKLVRIEDYFWDERLF